MNEDKVKFRLHPAGFIIVGNFPGYYGWHVLRGGLTVDMGTAPTEEAAFAAATERLDNLKPYHVPLPSDPNC